MSYWHHEFDNIDDPRFKSLGAPGALDFSYRPSLVSSISSSESGFTEKPYHLYRGNEHDQWPRPSFSRATKYIDKSGYLHGAGIPGRNDLRGDTTTFPDDIYPSPPSYYRKPSPRLSDDSSDAQSCNAQTKRHNPPRYDINSLSPDFNSLPPTMSIARTAIENRSCRGYGLSRKADARQHACRTRWCSVCSKRSGVHSAQVERTKSPLPVDSNQSAEPPTKKTHISSSDENNSKDGEVVQNEEDTGRTLSDQGRVYAIRKAIQVTEEMDVYLNIIESEEDMDVYLNIVEGEEKMVPSSETCEIPVDVRNVSDKPAGEVEVKLKDPQSLCSNLESTSEGVGDKGEKLETLITKKFSSKSSTSKQQGQLDQPRLCSDLQKSYSPRHLPQNRKGKLASEISISSRYLKRPRPRRRKRLPWKVIFRVRPGSRGSHEVSGDGPKESPKNLPSAMNARYKTPASRSSNRNPQKRRRGDDEDNDPNKRPTKKISLSFEDFIRKFGCPLGRSGREEYAACRQRWRKDLTGIREHLRRTHFGGNELPDNLSHSSAPEWHDIFAALLPDWVGPQPEPWVYVTKSDRSKVLSMEELTSSLFCYGTSDQENKNQNNFNVSSMTIGAEMSLQSNNLNQEEGNYGSQPGFVAPPIYSTPYPQLPKVSVSSEDFEASANTQTLWTVSNGRQSSMPTIISSGNDVVSSGQYPSAETLPTHPAASLKVTPSVHGSTSTDTAGTAATRVSSNDTGSSSSNMVSQMTSSFSQRKRDWVYLVMIERNPAIQISMEDQGPERLKFMNMSDVEENLTPRLQEVFFDPVFSWEDWFLESTRTAAVVRDVFGVIDQLDFDPDGDGRAKFYLRRRAPAV